MKLLQWPPLSSSSPIYQFLGPFYYFNFWALNAEEVRSIVQQYESNSREISTVASFINIGF